LISKVKDLTVEELRTLISDTIIDSIRDLVENMSALSSENHLHFYNLKSICYFLDSLLENLDKGEKSRIAEKLKEYAREPLAYTRKLIDSKIGIYRFRIGNIQTYI